MIKKQSEGFEPVVSQIPVPQSDSPLIIDLPDGQKLVIGNLANGTVIEVATWRGTGRPDSRTQRLMLGVSGAPEAESHQPEAVEIEVSDGSFKKEVAGGEYPAGAPQVNSAYDNTNASLKKNRKRRNSAVKAKQFLKTFLYFLQIIAFPFINAFLPRSKHLKAKNPSQKRIS